MKIATIIVRVLIGALLLFASVSFFLKLFPTPELTGDLKTFNEGMAASGYLMNLVKSLELLCGLAFVSGFFVRLANLVLLPISVNIIMVHLCLDPANIGMGALVFLGNIFLIYRYWNDYKAIFKP
ncbi:DoxX family membrane protein [Flavobacterium suncheonense]|uniref:DoxX family protein n=1 Tax=Flavobacterium suncheonense GH29-5 = DSM 17707 TaxID=1121899 RepID=A0A0A2M3H1_9FLAO|nr:DoxX family membrane protein [Flavobacterium suncheonense]KGO87152.1 DoxX family protein [Flavobacterium suncheonense GH29-5 = DSM 17707]